MPTLNEQVRQAPIATSIAAVVTALAAAGGARNSIGNFGGIVGYSFSTAGIIFIVLWASSLRQKPIKSGWVHFGFLFAVAVISLSMALAYQKSQYKQAANNISNSFNQLADENMNSVTASEGRTQGEAGELERLMTTYMTKMKSDRTDYTRQLGALGVDKILTPEHLAVTSDFGPDREKLADARATVERFRNRALAQLDDIKASIQNSGLSQENKDSALKGIANTQAASIQRMNRLYDLEIQSTDDMSGVTRLLDSSRGKWSVQGGKVIFQSGRDLERFNDMMGDISKAAAEEQAIRSAAEDQSRQSFARMKEETQ